MFDCTNSWLNAQAYMAQSMNQKALTSLSHCFESGEFHPQMVHLGVRLLDEQGQGVHALHLLEMTSRHHIYHPRLEILKSSLLELRDLPGSLSPLAILNQNPMYFTWFSLLLFTSILAVFLWKWSPLRKVLCEKITGVVATTGSNSLDYSSFKNSKLSLVKLMENSVLVALVLGCIFCSFIAGVNYWDDHQNYLKPAFIVKSNSALYEKSVGPTAVAQVQGGTLGKIYQASDLDGITMRWPGKKYQEPKSAERTRVKVVFSSGQSGYLWEDQILLLEKQK